MRYAQVVHDQRLVRLLGAACVCNAAKAENGRTTGSLVDKALLVCARKYGLAAVQEQFDVLCDWPFSAGHQTALSPCRMPRRQLPNRLAACRGGNCLIALRHAAAATA